MAVLPISLSVISRLRISSWYGGCVVLVRKTCRGTKSQEGGVSFVFGGTFENQIKEGSDKINIIKGNSKIEDRRKYENQDGGP